MKTRMNLCFVDNRLNSSTVVSSISQAPDERLRMVEQPCHNSKLRYRADYVREKGRLGAIGNKNDRSKLKGPAISVSFINLFILLSHKPVFSPH